MANTRNFHLLEQLLEKSEQELLAVVQCSIKVNNIDKARIFLSFPFQECKINCSWLIFSFFSY